MIQVEITNDNSVLKVHRPGCRDLTKVPAHAKWIETVATVRELVMRTFGEFEDMAEDGSNWQDFFNEFDIMPCCGDIPEENDMTEITETVQTVAPTTDQSIAELRKKAGVSRADLQKATGLTASVVWRAEAKNNVTDEQHALLVGTLLDWITYGKPAGTGRKGGRPRSAVSGSQAMKDSLAAKDTRIDAQTAEIADLRLQLDAQLTEVAELRELLNSADAQPSTDAIYVSDLTAKIEQLLTEARTGKRSTKDIKALLDWVNDR